MTQTATPLPDPLPDSAPRRRDLLERVREARRVADAAEREILELAAEYAVSCPALPGGEVWEPAQAPSWLEETTELDEAEEAEWIGLPALAWDAPAAFAAANQMTTEAGKALIRDVLALEFRLPGFWDW